MKMEQVLAEGGPVAPSLLEALGIQPDWLTRWPGELSGGELQRFCIARALGPATQILLCDEMSAMLDYITQAQLWRVVLDEAKRRNLGLLVVSHAGKLLQQVCTRTITL